MYISIISLEAWPKDAIIVRTMFVSCELGYDLLIKRQFMWPKDAIIIRTMFVSCELEYDLLI